MSDVPIRPQAREAAEMAYKRVAGRVSKQALVPAIQAFLAAEEVEPERMNARPEHQGEDWIPEVRLCGPWRRVDA